MYNHGIFAVKYLLNLISLRHQFGHAHICLASEEKYVVGNIAKTSGGSRNYEQYGR